MINILFALIAIGALCIDIILNRGLLEEIEDESKEHNKRLESLFEKLKLPRATLYAKNAKDKIEGLTGKLKIEVKDGCASKNAHPFYWIIVILALMAIISVLADICRGDEVIADGFFQQKMYPVLGILGTLIWMFALGYFVCRLCKLLAFHNRIENDRVLIRKRVDETILNARLLVGDPTSPLGD